MNGDLISRSALMARCNEIADCEWNHRAAPISWADAYETFADMAEDAPAVDAVEVVRCKDCKHCRDVEIVRSALEAEPMRHGRWNADGSCSECGEFDNKDPYGSNYCPNCGAKMDGGETE